MRHSDDDVRATVVFLDAATVGPCQVMFLQFLANQLTVFGFIAVFDFATMRAFCNAMMGFSTVRFALDVFAVEKTFMCGVAPLAFGCARAAIVLAAVHHLVGAALADVVFFMTGVWVGH